MHVTEKISIGLRTRISVALFEKRLINKITVHRVKFLLRMTEF